MRINKYGNTKCMIENLDGTYTFLNVSMWEAMKFYIASRIKNSIKLGERNAKEKSNSPENMDR